ncbi:MAG: PIG-L family deacetylase [Desulfosudis oleivorans]|nr:PIG-L family deacetylase [Desulfosudis oleivorans]
MGVVDATLSNEDAAATLKRDQFAAARIVGVREQYWCGYPDAGEYNYFDLRRDFLKYIRILKPDFVFAPDAWLTYEGHRDHIQTGLAAAEAVMFAGLTKIASSDPKVDSAYEGHSIQGIAFYFTREPNFIADISSTWEDKIGAVRCYEAQFDPERYGTIGLCAGYEVPTSGTGTIVCARRAAQGVAHQRVACRDLVVPL